MIRARRSPSVRLLLALVLASCLAVRLLTPAGFMPAFADGALAIVECPEADGAPPPAAMADMPGMDMTRPATPAHDHQHGKQGFHQLCPYAQAASLVGVDPGVVILAVVVLLAALSPLARALLAIPRRSTRDRPPSQAPPLPA